MCDKCKVFKKDQKPTENQTPARKAEPVIIKTK